MSLLSAQTLVLCLIFSFVVFCTLLFPAFLFFFLPIGPAAFFHLLSELYQGMETWRGGLMVAFIRYDGHTQCWKRIVKGQALEEMFVCFSLSTGFRTWRDGWNLPFTLGSNVHNGGVKIYGRFDRLLLNSFLSSPLGYLVLFAFLHLCSLAILLTS